MSQENVEIVRMLQPSGEDLVAMTEELRLAHEEMPSVRFADGFETTFVAEDQTSGPHRGVEGFIAGWRDWLEPWARYELTAEEYIDAGDRVVVFARVRARTRRDGVEVEHAPAAVYTLRDGLVRRVEFYLDRTEALKAVGLEG